MVDDLDNQIIETLSLDGRMSNASIARNLGVSEGTIRRRLNILKDEGIIDIKVVLNPNYVASETEAIIGIQVDLPVIRQVVLKLNQINEIRWVNITSGSFDIFVNVSTKSLSDLLELLQNKIGNIDGVKKIETFTTLDVPKDKLRGI
ncbi:MAG TPA: Lrp/AsnC family transcriptional regulator [SAR202 cluster bacterium]|jgi:Lrp/AsnC family transcriptional regulator for asnA, asnC and gidA|uniref:HTH asnC-type domain-containing protein n=1 Tax=marine metagenome TaxID=408172 RepID=A0A382MA57_9ZZZZ|nr:Lrp/AsnC family transcriptional regulator [SAR202 cluster bacterium]HJO59367.1 Lrp/AsnC family transcriptional regulator [SAR202 cluster bacterium]|tara:strand:+ start:6278 stop:6718 length:441 start_codon:yes stop_codon:yes gene_type:complete